MARRTFKFRLYPNRQQKDKRQATLDVCRELYNAALQERRGSVKMKQHRDSKGEVKTLTIQRENGMWYACFSCVAVLYQVASASSENSVGSIPG